MAAEGYAYLAFLSALEALAIIVGIVGVIHTSDLGGRLAAMLYAVPTIVLALIPPVSLWGFTGGFSRWHALVLLPVVLAATCVYYGFRKQRRRREDS